MPTSPYIKKNIKAQEQITSENINSDVTLTDTIDQVPQSNAAVDLFWEGNHMTQGVGQDYTISGQSITWLAGTGTAPNMTASDIVIVSYLYET